MQFAETVSLSFALICTVLAPYRISGADHCSLQAGWAVIPSKNLFVFPQSKNPEIAAFGKDQAGTGASADPNFAAAATALGSKGVVRGVPMSTMVGPSLKLAHQLETIV